LLVLLRSFERVSHEWIGKKVLVYHEFLLLVKTGDWLECQSALFGLLIFLSLARKGIIEAECELSDLWVGHVARKISPLLNLEPA